MITLGPKGWCLTNDGELLHFILDNVLDRLDTPVFEKLRDKIDIHIEQALFCLYQHPSKKNKVNILRLLSMDIIKRYTS